MSSPRGVASFREQTARMDAAVSEVVEAIDREYDFHDDMSDHFEEGSSGAGSEMGDAIPPPPVGRDLHDELDQARAAGTTQATVHDTPHVRVPTPETTYAELEHTAFVVEAIENAASHVQAQAMVREPLRSRESLVELQEESHVLLNQLLEPLGRAMPRQPHLPYDTMRSILDDCRRLRTELQPVYDRYNRVQAKREAVARDAQIVGKYTVDLHSRRKRFETARGAIEQQIVAMQRREEALTALGFTNKSHAERAAKVERAAEDQQARVDAWQRALEDGEALLKTREAHLEALEAEVEKRLHNLQRY